MLHQAISDPPQTSEGRRVAKELRHVDQQVTVQFLDFRGVGPKPLGILLQRCRPGAADSAFQSTTDRSRLVELKVDFVGIVQVIKDLPQVLLLRGLRLKSIVVGLAGVQHRWRELPQGRGSRPTVSRGTDNLTDRRPRGHPPAR